MVQAFEMKNLQAQDDRILKITPAACERLEILFAAEIKADSTATPLLALRVDAGGCSGFQYCLDIVKAPNPEDILLEYKTLKVAIDSPSLDLLQGSSLDFTQELMGAAFVIRNPNASSACGCGNSFSIF